MTSRSLLPVLALATVFAMASTAFFSAEGKFDAAVIMIPFVAMICIMAIAVITHNNPFLFKMMVVALAAKMFAAWAYTAMPTFQDSDIQGLYFSSASQLAGSITHLTDYFPLQQLWGTNLIIAIGACLFAVVGSSLAAAMIMFAIASFWGQYLSYRACVLAFPRANKRTAAGLLLFFPSLVYWTSAFGKDALMILAIGLISYGIARRFDGKGCAAIFAGLILATLIRPHIGAVIVISLFASYLFGNIKSRRRLVGFKFLLFPLFFAISLFVVVYARDSLEVGSLEEAEAKSDYAYKYNRVGGSAFDAGESTPQKLVLSPLLLFRPFPWEINNWTAAMASCEGLGLLLFVLLRRAAICRLLWHARSVPLTVFAVSLFVIFSAAVSLSISNFGLLARQRAMILPPVLSLLAACGSFRRGRNVGLAHSSEIGVTQ